MKAQTLIGILFTLLSCRRISAGELAAKYGCSERTIFRYVDELTCAGIPIDVSRGIGGGICISDAYKLPHGILTRPEAARMHEALLAINEQLRDPALASAIEKFESQYMGKCSLPSSLGNIYVDSGSWGDTRQFSDKLALVERAVEEREALRIDYVSREGEKTHRVILPHLLVYKQNIWYVFAFCRMRNEFRLFKIGRMRTILNTGETFERLPFTREDIPLSFWTDDETCVNARFALSEESIPFAEEWLGVEAVYEKDGRKYAEATLPDDDSLVGKILSAGTGFTVLAPVELAARVQKAAETIAAAYHTPATK